MIQFDFTVTRIARCRERLAASSIGLPRSVQLNAANTVECKCGGRTCSEQRYSTRANGRAFASFALSFSDFEPVRKSMSRHGENAKPVARPPPPRLPTNRIFASRSLRTWNFFLLPSVVGKFSLEEKKSFSRWFRKRIRDSFNNKEKLKRMNF